MKKEIQKIKLDFMNFIADKDATVHLLQESIASLQETVTFMQDKSNRWPGAICSIEDHDILKDDVKNFNEMSTKLEENIDGTDAYERRDVVLLFGPAVPVGSTRENCTVFSLDIIKESSSSS